MADHSPGWVTILVCQWRTCELVVIVSTPATRMVLLFKDTLLPLVDLDLAARGSWGSKPIQAASKALNMAPQCESGEILLEAACTAVRYPKLTLGGLFTCGCLCAFMCINRMY